MFFQSINDTLYKNQPFRISVFLPTDAKGVEKYKSEIVTIKGTSEQMRLELNTVNRLMLGFHVIVDKNNYKELKMFFSSKLFVNLNNAFEVCTEWMTSKNFDYLFKKNTDGEIYGIGEVPPYAPAIYKTATEFIRFQPAVVRDLTGTKCEGVRAETQEGPFYQWTCTEFLIVSQVVRQFIAHHYQITLQLLNLGVNIYNTMKPK